MRLSAAQVRQACVLLNWKLPRLSHRAQISYKPALLARRDEGIRAVSDTDLSAIRIALQKGACASRSTPTASPLPCCPRSSRDRSPTPPSSVGLPPAATRARPISARLGEREYGDGRGRLTAEEAGSTADGVPSLPIGAMRPKRGMTTEDTMMPKTAAQPAIPDAIVKTRKPGLGLSKPMMPSVELAAIVGPGPMPRTEVVGKMWVYIKEHGLKNPADGREIVADDKLRAVFGRDRATMFEMQKLISPHLTAA